MDGAPDGISEVDARIRKLDPDTGFWLWTRRFGLPQPQVGDHLISDVTDIAIDATGLYFTGSTFGTFPGQT